MTKHESNTDFMKLDTYSFFNYFRDQFIYELELQQKDIKTIDNYQYIVDNFIEYFHQNTIIWEQLNHRIVIAAIRYCESNSRFNNYAYWTNYSYKKTIKLFINFIEDEMDNSFNIKWNNIKFKKDIKETNHILDNDLLLIKNFLSSLHKKLSMTKNKDNFTGEIKSREYVFTVNMAFKLGLNLGLRADEICKLTLEDFSNEYRFKNNLYVDIKIDGKGNKERILPIKLSKIKKELEYYKSSRNSKERILKQIRGKDLTRHSLYNYFKDIFSSLDIKSRGIHILRHTFAMKLKQNGVDLADAQDFLGHSDPSITRIYFKKNENQMRKIANLKF